MDEFSFIRHGEKLKLGEDRKALEDSGLTEEQQEKWKEAVGALKLEDPELAYEALPKIEQLSREVYDSLPGDALLLFLSTDTPRTKLTANLLSSELFRLEQQNGKNIAVACLWEPENNNNQDGLRDVSTGDITDRMKRILIQDSQDEQALKEYFDSGGNKTFAMEDELVMKAINEELVSDNSAIKKRAQLLKAQYERLSEKFKDEKRPLFFYCVSHHSGLVALDVAFNGREKYNSADEIPKPLSLWKAKLDRK